MQHASEENAWVGIDGNTGAIVDMREQQVRSAHMPPRPPRSAAGPGVDDLTVAFLLCPPPKIWDSFNVKAQTFKTAIEAACMILRIDDIVSGIKKKQAPGAGPAPSKPKIEEEGDADGEQILPD